MSVEYFDKLPAGHLPNVQVFSERRRSFEHTISLIRERMYLTPATANSSFLLIITLFDCNNFTEIFRTPGGNFKSTRFALAARVGSLKSRTFHTQNPNAAVPSSWFSFSLRLSCKSASSPGKIPPTSQLTLTSSLFNSRVSTTSCLGVEDGFLLSPVWSSSNFKKFEFVIK